MFMVGKAQITLTPEMRPSLLASNPDLCIAKGLGIRMRPILWPLELLNKAKLSWWAPMHYEGIQN